MWVVKMKENGEYDDGSGDIVYLLEIDNIVGEYYGTTNISWAKWFYSVEELTTYVVNGGMDMEEITIENVSD